jgi:hypothetical protein
MRRAGSSHKTLADKASPWAIWPVLAGRLRVIICNGLMLQAYSLGLERRRILNLDLVDASLSQFSSNLVAAGKNGRGRKQQHDNDQQDGNDSLHLGILFCEDLLCSQQDRTLSQWAAWLFHTVRRLTRPKVTNIGKTSRSARRLWLFLAAAISGQASARPRASAQATMGQNPLRRSSPRPVVWF